MARLMLVVGLIWAIIGVLNIVMMPWGGEDVGASIASFGLTFNMVLFILPGLVVAGIGSALGKRSREQQATQAAVTATESATRACPFCAEVVKSEARICRYCRRDIPPDPALVAAATAQADADAAERADIGKRVDKWERRWRRILRR